MYGNNPHYQLGDLHVYLNPDPGGPHNHPQWNIRCDPQKSDFNVMVIQTRDLDYFSFKYDKPSGILKITDTPEKPYELYRAKIYLKRIYESIKQQSRTRVEK